MISVLDENDNPPKFQRNSYEAEIAENSPAYTTVVPVSYAFYLRAIKIALLFPLFIRETIQSELWFFPLLALQDSTQDSTQDSILWEQWKITKIASACV